MSCYNLLSVPGNLGTRLNPFGFPSPWSRSPILPTSLNVVYLIHVMAYPVESDAARSPFPTSGSLIQPPRPTCLPCPNILDRTTISPPFMTTHIHKQHPSPTTISSNSRFSRTHHLMFIPPIRSKLSVILFSSSDMDKDNLNSPCSSCESSDSELDSSSPRKQKSSARKPTVSRLSFPFVKSAKSPPPSKCDKNTPSTLSFQSTTPPCGPSAATKRDTPSLTSPHPAPPFSHHPHYNPQRRSYRHRGYSRHALAHIQWFWAMREEHWEVKCGPVRKNKPHLEESFLETALDDPLASLLSPCNQKRKVPMHPVHQPQHELPPMTIHPRRGDLSTLRDPYCTEIDRNFVGLPMWTIGKTLWMYDVHLASQDRARGGDPDSHDVSDAYETESESESLGTAASVVSCDDSDMTLVDSETESEVSPDGGSNSSSEDNDVGTLRDQHIIKKHLVLTHDNSYSGLSSSMTPGRAPPVRALSDTSLVLSCPPHQRRSRSLRSAYCSRPLTPIAATASGSGKKLARQSSWATDWYRRWECMIEVSHRRQMVEGKCKFFLNYEPEDDLDRFEAISLL